MDTLAKVVLGVGAISMIIGVILRIMVKQVTLGLTPSSFLEFSIGCFLLTIALNTLKK